MPGSSSSGGGKGGGSASSASHSSGNKGPTGAQASRGNLSSVLSLGKKTTAPVPLATQRKDHGSQSPSVKDFMSAAARTRF
jgi:hypothetical protein